MDLEERVGNLEQRQAALEAQLTDARREIRTLSALPVQFAELANSVLNLKDDIKEISDAISSRDRQASDERRSVRIAMLSLIGVILAAVIAAVGAIVVAKIGATPS